jgi:hypothetical protein
MQAFDGDVVGYEGMVVDLKAVSVAYDEADYQIADFRKQIEDAQARIELRKNSGGPKAAAAIGALQTQIAAAQARIHELELRKEIRDAECLAKGPLWSTLEKFLQSDLAAEQSYLKQAPAGSDGQAGIQDQIDRDQRQLAVVKSEIAGLSALCARIDQVVQDKEAAKVGEAVEKAYERAKAIHDDVAAIAEKGRFGDLPDMGHRLEPLLGTAKQAQLMGYEEIGLKMQQLAIDDLQKFAYSAGKSCKDERFDVSTALVVERQLQLIGLEGKESEPSPLAPCLYRLKAAGGGVLPGLGSVYMRTCTDGFSPATWDIRIQTRHLEAKGSANSTAPRGTIKMESDTEGKATLSGMFLPNDNVTYPFHLDMHGPVKLRTFELISKPGLLTRSDAAMTIEWTVEPYKVTNVYGRTSNVPGYTLDAEEGPVVTINQGKPCDPSKSVWDY